MILPSDENTRVAKSVRGFAQASVSGKLRNDASNTKPTNPKMGEIPTQKTRFRMRICRAFKLPPPGREAAGLRAGGGLRESFIQGAVCSCKITPLRAIPV